MQVESAYYSSIKTVTAMFALFVTNILDIFRYLQSKMYITLIYYHSNGTKSNINISFESG